MWKWSVLGRTRAAGYPTALDREAFVKRDDPIGEVVRIIATLRQDPTSLASWDAIAELQKKLPDEVADGAEPVKVDGHRPQHGD